MAGPAANKTPMVRCSTNSEGWSSAFFSDSSNLITSGDFKPRATLVVTTSFLTRNAIATAEEQARNLFEGPKGVVDLDR